MPNNPVLQLFLDCALPFLIAIPTYFLVDKKALQIKDRFQVERAGKAPPAESAAVAASPDP